MQTLELQVERCENALTLGHLATLPKRNKDHFISTFTQQQQHYFQQYLYEGQRVARSWDDPISMSPPIINPRASPKNDPQLGFGTPVLRARLDLISTGCPNGPINTGRSKTAGGQETSKENEKPSGHNANLLDAAIYDFKLKAERQKKIVSRSDKKRSKKHNLPSDSENESVERRADRCQRKKTKRAIMSPEISEDSDKQDKPSTTCKKAKRQSKLRQEFALIHGFSSTNVGRNRLTLNPDIGVFQKGKASRKTDVIQAGKNKKQKLGFHFSEAKFLGKSRKKVSKIDFEKVAKTSTTREEDSTVVSSASTSILDSTKTRTDPDTVKVRSRKFKDRKALSKSNLVSKRMPESQDKAQTGYDPANSIVWDIEQASDVSSGVKQGTIVLELAHSPLKSNEVPGNEALDTNITTLEAHVKLSEHKSLSVTQFHALSSPSLGPSQSASQIDLKTVNVDSLPTVPSKYFKPLPPTLAEPHLALTRYTTNQFDTRPPAFSELGKLSTIEDTIPQVPEPASHLHHSAGPPARSYYDDQEVRPNFISPMQPSYDDLEVSVYYEGYPDSEFWSPVDHPGDLSVERFDTDVSVDHTSVSFNGQNAPDFDILADDEVWTLDYTACREPSEMDQIHDTPFISGYQSVELHNDIPPSTGLSDAYSDVSERCQGVVYQYSGGDRLDLESEDQQMQPDDEFNQEYEGVSSMDLEPYPDVVHHFWQGRSLLYGLRSSGDSSSLHKLSNVEADVARQLQLDHWQPQKL